MLFKGRSHFNIALLIIASLLPMLLFLSRASTKHTKPPFHAFVQGIKKEASEKGISARTINKYLNRVKAPKVRPIVRLAHQAQKVLSFSHYLNRLTPAHKVKRAQKEYKKHKALLDRIGKEFNVQPQFIIALWGIESDFGQDVGQSDLIASLTTLAYQHHRSQFYRHELINALKILDKKHVIPNQTKSSWDGGMGQTQFMPTTYFDSAYDYDKNGFKNIWTNLPDVFASIANFLHQYHWNGHRTWGIRVKVPKTLPLALAGIKNKLTIKKWKTLGIKPEKGYHFPKNETYTGSLILPDKSLAPAYLVYYNFHVLYIWNHSTYEALAASLFSDKIISNNHDK